MGEGVGKKTKKIHVRESGRKKIPAKKKVKKKKLRQKEGPIIVT